jgi:hypothetical protein
MEAPSSDPTNRARLECRSSVRDLLFHVPPGARGFPRSFPSDGSAQDDEHALVGWNRVHPNKSWKNGEFKPIRFTDRALHPDDLPMWQVGSAAMLPQPRRRPVRPANRCRLPRLSRSEVRRPTVIGSGIQRCIGKPPVTSASAGVRRTYRRRHPLLLLPTVIVVRAGRMQMGGAVLITLPPGTCRRICHIGNNGDGYRPKRNLTVTVQRTVFGASVVTGDRKSPLNQKTNVHPIRIQVCFSLPPRTILRRRKCRNLHAELKQWPNSRRG